MSNEHHRGRVAGGHTVSLGTGDFKFLYEISLEFLFVLRLSKVPSTSTVKVGPETQSSQGISISSGSNPFDPSKCKRVGIAIVPAGAQSPGAAASWSRTISTGTSCLLSVVYFTFVAPKVTDTQ
eukprot:UN00401